MALKTAVQRQQTIALAIEYLNYLSSSFTFTVLPMKEAIWQQALPSLPTTVGNHPTKTPRPDFGLDPLDFVELVLQIEQHFGIKFSAADLTELRMVQLLLSGVEQPLRRPLYAEFFAQLLQNGQWL